MSTHPHAHVAGWFAAGFASALAATAALIVCSANGIADEEAHR